MWRSVWLVLGLTFLTGAVFGEELPPVGLSGTEVRELASSLIDQTYRIFVALPRGYGASEARYPVIYVLDADILFGTVAETARLLPLEGFFLGRQSVPEALIVGIAYPGGFDEMAAKRGRDFTPTTEPSQDGAARFFRFLKEQLIPMIESNYRADPGDRALIGTSAGGLFVLDTLLRHPGTFQRYLATSPRMDDILFRREEETASRMKDLPGTLYLSAGDAGEIEQQIAAGVETFHTRLAARGYPSLRLIHESLEGESHVSAQPIAFTHGLKAVFETPPGGAEATPPSPAGIPSGD
ncbi:MAG: alpha/beta hydrolase-fold protein [Acidobacteriota bacterium]